MKTASLFFLLLLCISDILAQPGALDKSFGNGGVSLVGFGRREDIAEDIVVQSDGKILLAGYSDLAGQETSMIRLNTDGSLDTTFGKGGKVDYNGETHSHNQRIMLYPNGTILICADDAARPVMMWFKPDGTVDSSFAKNGRLGEFFADDHGLYHRVFLLEDSSLIAAGSHGHYDDDSNTWVYDIGLTYLKKSGVIDSSKGKNGRVLFDALNKHDYAFDAIMQRNGKIVIGGSYGSYFTKDFTLHRFNRDGSLDLSFGTGGRSIVDVTDTMDWLIGLSSQPDGKMLAAGIWYDSTDERPVIVRYHENGIVDTSFGSDGIVKIDNNIESDWIYKAMMDSAGRIVAVGSLYDGVSSVTTLYRLLANGKLDSSFGENGLARFDVGTRGDGAEAMAIQSDGKYVLGGDSYRSDTVDYDFAVLRVLVGGELDVKNDNKSNSITSQLSVYPNPLTDNITIRAELENDSYCTLKLYGERGELVKIFFHDESYIEGVFEESIWLRDIPQGVYFLTLDDGSGIRSVKVMKE